MDDKAKIAFALEVLDEYEDEWGHKVPARILKFWKSGEALRYDRKCIPGGLKIPGWGSEKSSFRLVPSIPSWDVLANCDGLDDAVVGVEGEWEHAGEFIPLF